MPELRQGQVPQSTSLLLPALGTSGRFHLLEGLGSQKLVEDVILGDYGQFT